MTAREERGDVKRKERDGKVSGGKGRREWTGKESKGRELREGEKERKVSFAPTIIVKSQCLWLLQNVNTCQHRGASERCGRHHCVQYSAAASFQSRQPDWRVHWPLWRSLRWPSCVGCRPCWAESSLYNIDYQPTSKSQVWRLLSILSLFRADASCARLERFVKKLYVSWNMAVFDWAIENRITTFWDISQKYTNETENNKNDLQYVTGSDAIR